MLSIPIKTNINNTHHLCGMNLRALARANFCLDNKMQDFVLKPE